MTHYRNNQQIIAQAKRLIASHAIDNPRIRDQVIASVTGALYRHMSNAPTTGRGYQVYAELCRIYSELKGAKS